MRVHTTSAFLLLFVMMSASIGSSDQKAAIVEILSPSPSGVSMVPIVLRGLPPSPTNAVPKVAVRHLPSGEEIPASFIPDPDDEQRTSDSLSGTLLMQNRTFRGAFLVTFVRWNPISFVPSPQELSVRTTYYSVFYEPHRSGGFPARIVLHPSGLSVERVNWNDRVYRASDGGYLLRNDSAPRLILMADTAFVKVIRSVAQYCRPDGSVPSSAPNALYDWYYFADLPLIAVIGQFRQREPSYWDEVHFLEINLPELVFPEWAYGEPVQKGTFTASQKSFAGAEWGAFVNGPSILALLRGGQPLFHDGHGAYGTYLHAFGDQAWQPTSATMKRWAAWLLAGSFADPIAAVRKWRTRIPDQVEAKVFSPELWHQMQAQKSPSSEHRWRLLVAQSLDRSGATKEALQVLKGTIPDHLLLARSGRLTAVFLKKDDGLSLMDLLDTKTSINFLARQRSPFFRIILKDIRTGQTHTLTSDAGWESVAVVNGRSWTLLWRGPRVPDPIPLTVKVSLRRYSPDFFAADLTVDNKARGWSVWTVEFPVMHLGRWLSAGKVFVPQGPGQVLPVTDSGPRYWARYPGFSACVQYLAAYTEKPPSVGLYVSHHDPFGSVKDLSVQRPDPDTVTFSFSVPAPDMGREGNDFDLSGAFVFGLFSGDWYDATEVYKKWARKESFWIRKAKQFAIDKSSMAPICAWALSSGGPDEVVGPVETFARYLSAPSAVHWYNWHQIPFDNDYPHYFPTKKGFPEGVARLQKGQIAVMPYINGRLWDTRDKGREDFQFSLIAFPAATKKEKGEIYTESYGSTEDDGTPVRLAPMCPSTKLWRDKVKDIVLKLVNDYKVKGVYIDQVAAANPVLCFDPSHPHPLGGGFWWNRSYWMMLDAIRQEMPSDRFLTTECNAEPFIGWFDGYLTWHWQFDGQVPAFPALYSPYILMFGRAYRGGATKDLALRMKAAQQLVFGEQIGWIDPSVVNEAENAAFLKDIVTARKAFLQFFLKGEMERPPSLTKPVPIVRADWQWSGEWWVSTPAIIAGAWSLPSSGRTAFIFVNVGDSPLEATFPVDPKKYRRLSPQGSFTLWEPNGTLRPFAVRLGEEVTILLPPRSLRVLLFSKTKAPRFKAIEIH
ncbi:MAG: DUF6259 domain-containing protein [Armatimonadetes bacterium]|nr:DUF6259 domain-containing protein [Armatimonadota bacterium]MDW8122827.1 DUF6259 domain-containing protein [Armatimonadota bacterium]